MTPRQLVAWNNCPSSVFSDTMRERMQVETEDLLC